MNDEIFVWYPSRDMLSTQHRARLELPLNDVTIFLKIFGIFFAVPRKVQAPSAGADIPSALSTWQ